MTQDRPPLTPGVKGLPTKQEFMDMLQGLPEADLAAVAIMAKHPATKRLVYLEFRRRHYSVAITAELCHARKPAVRNIFWRADEQDARAGVEIARARENDPSSS